MGTSIAGFNPFKTLVLDFSKTRYKGAEVKVRVDFTYEDANDLISRMFPKGEALPVPELHAIFAEEVLIEWNLVDRDDKTITADAEGIKRAPTQLVKYAIDTWYANLFDVSAPLGEESTPG